MRRLAAAVSVAGVALALTGIGSFVPAAPVHAAESSVTWSRDVAPIVYKNCTSCHRTGGSGPFSLLTYRDAQRWGGLMEQVTASRYMPPWLPEPGHGDFQDSRRLGETDIATIKAWVAGGMAQGDAAKGPKTPVYTSEWELGKPDLVLADAASPFPCP